MLIDYKLGQQSIVLRVFLQDASKTTGEGLVALSSASSGLCINTIADNEASSTNYTVAGSTIEAVTTLGTFAPPTATKCRFKKIDDTNMPGIYEIQIDNTRYAVSSAKSLVILIFGATNLSPTPVCIPLRTFDQYGTTNMGIAALPAIASGSAGGVLIQGTGTTGLNVVSGKAPVTLASTDVTGNVATDLQTIKTQTVTCAGGVTVPAATLASTANITGGTITTVTNLTNAPTSGDLTAAMKASVTTAATAATPTAAAVTGAVGSVTGNVGGSVASVVGAVGSVTGNVGGSVASVVGAVGSVTGNVGGSVASVVGAVGSVTGAVGSVTGAVGSVTGAVGSVTGNVGGNVTGSIGSLATQAKADVTGAVPTASQNATAVRSGAAMTEAYAANGAAPTLEQCLFLIQQKLCQFSIVGTTLTVKKIDGSTTAAVFDLGSTTPTSQTRTS